VKAHVEVLAVQLTVLLAGLGHALQRVPQALVESLGTHSWPHACWFAGQAQVPAEQVAPIGQSLGNRHPVRQCRDTGSQK
jgi:hypothetical protein